MNFWMSVTSAMVVLQLSGLFRKRFVAVCVSAQPRRRPQPAGTGLDRFAVQRSLGRSESVRRRLRLVFFLELGRLGAEPRQDRFLPLLAQPAAELEREFGFPAIQRIQRLVDLEI